MKFLNVRDYAITCCSLVLIVTFSLLAVKYAVKLALYEFEEAKITVMSQEHQSVKMFALDKLYDPDQIKIDLGFHIVLVTLGILSLFLIVISLHDKILEAKQVYTNKSNF